MNEKEKKEIKDIWGPFFAEHGGSFDVIDCSSPEPPEKQPSPIPKPEDN